MTRGMRTLRSNVVDQLIESGGWLTSTELQDRLSCSQVALEDTLADLVVERKVEFWQSVGYRLAGTTLTRRAAQLMRERGVPAAAIAQRLGREFRVGVSETVVGERVTHEVMVDGVDFAALVDRMYEFGVVAAESLDSPSGPESLQRLAIVDALKSAPAGLGPREIAAAISVPVWDVGPMMSALTAAHLVRRTSDGNWHYTGGAKPLAEADTVLFLAVQEEACRA
ncbi:hypothetical protein [Ramlibacter sp.]|uniref:hypothetical protein n=1 Tax=Ramlibacter sp. TaxID=1917967 RepID=UPI003D1330C2